MTIKRIPRRSTYIGQHKYSEPHPPCNGKVFLFECRFERASKEYWCELCEFSIHHRNGKHEPYHDGGKVCGGNIVEGSYFVRCEKCDLMIMWGAKQ
jgi:hypothetical protein